MSLQLNMPQGQILAQLRVARQKIMTLKAERDQARLLLREAREEITRLTTALELAQRKMP